MSGANEGLVIPKYQPKAGEHWIRVADLSVKAAQELGVYQEGMFHIEIAFWKPPLYGDVRHASFAGAD